MGRKNVKQKAHEKLNTKIEKATVTTF
jgi:hypothetical protein